MTDKQIVLTLPAFQPWHLAVLYVFLSYVLFGLIIRYFKNELEHNYKYPPVELAIFTWFFAPVTFPFIAAFLFGRGFFKILTGI